MDAQKILYLLKKEENPKLDFKLKLATDTESAKKELAKDVSAIANSKGGRGFILFGIEDKSKEIIGIDKNEFQEEKIQQVVATRIDPPVPVSVDIVSVNQKDIGVITIYTTIQKPHQVRDSGAFYIRRGSTTDIMRKDEIASALEDSGVISHELLPVLKATIKDLDSEKVSDYLRKSGFPTGMDKNILLQTGILVDENDFTQPHPTFGGILLFGRSPETFLPHCVIRIHNAYNPKFPVHFIAKGTVIDMLSAACGFVHDCLDSLPFPFEVIEEHVAKSVLFRDYFDINNCIEIYLTQKNIEILNPGAAVKREESDKEKYVKRNMWLYLKLIAIDSEHQYFNKNFNSFQILKGRMKIKYLNIISKNLFKVIIPLHPLQSDRNSVNPSNTLE